MKATATNTVDDRVTFVRFGFHAANFADPIDAEATAERYEAALQARFPNAEIEVPFDTDAEGVLPHSLLAQIEVDGGDWYDGPGGYYLADRPECQAWNHMEAVIESVEPVYDDDSA